MRRTLAQLSGFLERCDDYGGAVLILDTNVFRQPFLQQTQRAFLSYEHISVVPRDLLFQFEMLGGEEIWVEVFRNNFVENVRELKKVLLGRHHQQAESLRLVQWRVAIVTTSRW